MIEDSGQTLSLHVFERNEHRPPKVYCTLWQSDRPLVGHEWVAHCDDLPEALSQADQALWAWGAGGQIGLVAYFMTRPDVWSAESNRRRAP